MAKKTRKVKTTKTETENIWVIPETEEIEKVDSIDSIEISETLETEAELIEKEIIEIDDETSALILNVLFMFPRYASFRLDSEKMIYDFKFFIDKIYEKTKNYSFKKYIYRITKNDHYAMENLLDKFFGIK